MKSTLKIVQRHSLNMCVINSLILETNDFIGARMTMRNSSESRNLPAKAAGLEDGAGCSVSWYVSKLS